MRFLLAFLLTLVLAFLTGRFMEWWSIALVAFLVALLIPQKMGKAFLSGLLGIAVLWSAIALWLDVPNQSILSQKVSELFKLGGSSFLLILVTAFIGGIVGGFAAMSGSSLRRLLTR